MPATSDRTPVILHCLFDALSEREGYDPSFLRPAIDHVASAALWPPTGIDEAAARWLADLLAGDAQPDDRTGADARIVQARAAARLAEVACALSLHADDETAAAPARDLWRAASRLLGHDGPAAATAQADDLTRLHAEAWRRLARTMAEDPMHAGDSFNTHSVNQTILGRAALDERDAIAGWLRRGGHDRLAELLDDGAHRLVPGPSESVAAPTPTDLYGRAISPESTADAPMSKATLVADLAAARGLNDRLMIENTTLKKQLECVTAEAARKVEEAQRKSKHGDPVRVEVVKAGESMRSYQVGMCGAVVVSTPTHWTVDLDNGIRVRDRKDCFRVTSSRHSS